MNCDATLHEVNERFAMVDELITRNWAKILTHLHSARLLGPVNQLTFELTSLTAQYLP